MAQIKAQEIRMKYASALPLTDEERDHCAASRAKTVEKGVQRRRVIRHKNQYNQSGTPDSRRLALRILGERDDDTLAR